MILRDDLYLKLTSVLVFTLLAASCHADSGSERCDEDGFATYRPVVADTRSPSNEGLFVVQKTASADHLRRVRLVLDHYKIEYRVRDGEVRIPCKVWKDKDYLVNITSKANDDSWLKSQGIKVPSK